jgi:hypothetical protein
MSIATSPLRLDRREAVERPTQLQTAAGHEGELLAAHPHRRVGCHPCPWFCLGMIADDHLPRDDQRPRQRGCLAQLARDQQLVEPRLGCPRHAP